VFPIILAAVLGAAVLGCGEEGETARSQELERRYGSRTAQTPVADSSAVGSLGDSTAAATAVGIAGDSALAPDPEISERVTPEPSPLVPGDTSGVLDVPPTGRTPTEVAGDEAPSEGAGAGEQEIDVDGLLSGAEDAYASLTSLRASFLQVMEVPLLERSSGGTGVWYQKGRNRFRMDFEDPPDDEIVADGTYLWIYHPSQTPRQVIRSELAREGTDSGTADLLARILSEARTSYTSSYDGRETVGGVEAHVVSLTPLGRSPYRLVRVWIAPGDRLVRRFQIVEVNESIRTVTLSNLEPNAALPDSLFRFTVPPGADVFSG
jgi:outer membrane lipoprotein-sorting protein